jgi:hypothetical protein
MLNILKNSTAPICRTCKHLVMDVKYPRDFGLARCSRIGKRCNVSGEITFFYADRCRRDYGLCGQEGAHYEKSTSDTLASAPFEKL